MKYIIFTITLLFSSTIFASDWVVFLVDTSGSMEEEMGNSGMTRMDAVKESIIKLTEDIPKETKVGILSFGKWEYNMQVVKKVNFEKAVNGLRPRGGTPLGQYMKWAADALLEARSKNNQGGLFKLIIATDGAANDMNLVNKYLPEILSRGIEVDAIGVDLEKDHALATNVDQYYNGNNLETLKQALKKSVSAEIKFDGIDGGEEIFEELESIPGNVAYEVVQYMTSEPNYPIGEKPPKKVVFDENSGKVISVEKTKLKDESCGFFYYAGIFGGVVLVFLLIYGICFKR